MKRRRSVRVLVDDVTPRGASPARRVLRVTRVLRRGGGPLSAAARRWFLEVDLFALPPAARLGRWS